MKQVITINNDNTFAEQETGLITLTTTFFTTVFDSFSASSTRYLSTTLAGRYILAGSAVAGFAGFLFGQRSGAKRERDGAKLTLETTKSFQVRLAMTNRKLAA